MEPAPPRTSSPAVIRRLALGFYGLLLVGSFAIEVLSRGSLLPETLFGGSAGESLLFGAALAVLILAVSGPLLRHVPWIRWQAQKFREILGPVDVATAATIALASGVAEEVFFRGVLQPRWGLVPTSILFGLLHVGPDRRYLAWTAFALILGFVLGGIVLWTGSLAGPIAAHVAINFVNLLRIGALDPLPEGGEESGEG